MGTNASHATVVDVQALLAQRMEHVIAREGMTPALQAELQPLLERHYQAISQCRDVPLEPRWDMYGAIDRAGKLLIVTARLDGRLTGYCCMIIERNLHYASLVCATQDVLWVDEEFRTNTRVGRDLIDVSDRLSADCGAMMIIRHSKAAHPIDAVLRRQGFALVDTLWTRRI